MQSLIKFKNELKASQSEDKKILKRLEAEIDLAKKYFWEITNISSRSFEQKFPVLHKEILISEEYKNFLKNSDNLFQVNLKDILENILKKNRTFYNLNQQIINAMDNDKIINYIDIQRLLLLLAISKLDLEETLEIFKKVIAFDIKYIHSKKNTNIINGEFVLLLEEFFDVEGNFVFGKNELDFKRVLEQIFYDFKLSYESLLKDGVIPTTLYITLTSGCDKLSCYFI